MPGGNFVFKMRNVTFAGSGQAGGEAVIMAPQHCGLYNDGMGTLCNVHYDLKDVDFTKVRNNGKWLGFGASGEEYIGLRLRGYIHFRTMTFGPCSPSDQMFTFGP